MPWPPHHLAITGETRDVQCEACARTVNADMLYELGDLFPEYPYTWACDACLSRMLNEGHIGWNETYQRWGAPPAIRARIAGKITAGQIRARRTPLGPFVGTGPLGHRNTKPGRQPGQGNARPRPPTSNRPLDDAGMPT